MILSWQYFPANGLIVRGSFVSARICNIAYKHTGQRCLLVCDKAANSMVESGDLGLGQ